MLVFQDRWTCSSSGLAASPVGGFGAGSFAAVKGAPWTQVGLPIAVPVGESGTLLDTTVPAFSSKP